MRNFRLRNIFLFLFFGLICNCSIAQLKESNSAEPEIISPQAAVEISKNSPGYASFSYSGLAFFDGKVYVSSTIGLLKYENGKLSGLYKWKTRNNVIEDIIYDRANNLLWSFHAGRNKLLRFDGKNWSFVDLPQIKGGYSRGNMLHGFQGLSTDSAFWLQSERTAWRLNPNDNLWIEEPIPEKPCFVTSEPNESGIACYKSHAPLKDKVLVIMHREYMNSYSESYPNTSAARKPMSDQVFFLQDNDWKEIPNESAIDFVTKDVVTGKDAVFVKTVYGNLFRLTASEIIPIETIGEVEAMTTTSAGNLLVSFRNDGVYELNNGWQKKFSSPYPPNEPEHFTYLAENTGQIALAISAIRNDASNNKFQGQTMLWISEGNELKPVPFE